MKVGIKILPKSEVLDSQGRAVSRTLNQHHYPVHDCRVGKYIVLDLPTQSESEARAEVKKMAEFVLHNPLIETFEIEVL